MGACDGVSERFQTFGQKPDQASNDDGPGLMMFDFEQIKVQATTSTGNEQTGRWARSFSTAGKTF